MTIKPAPERLAKTPAELRHHFCQIESELGDVRITLKRPNANFGSGDYVNRLASEWAATGDAELGNILDLYPSKTAEVVPLFI